MFKQHGGSKFDGRDRRESQTAERRMLLWIAALGGIIGVSVVIIVATLL